MNIIEEDAPQVEVQDADSLASNSLSANNKNKKNLVIASIVVAILVVVLLFSNINKYGEAGEAAVLVVEEIRSSAYFPEDFELLDDVLVIEKEASDGTVFRYIFVEYSGKSYSGKTIETDAIFIDDMYFSTLDDVGSPDLSNVSAENMASYLTFYINYGIDIMAEYLDSGTGERIVVDKEWIEKQIS